MEHSPEPVGKEVLKSCGVIILAMGLVIGLAIAAGAAYLSLVR